MMNDGELHVFNVVRYESHGFQVLHSCVKQETAEYLRDWEMALEHDRYLEARPFLIQKHGRLVDSFLDNLPSKIGVMEGEVIL